IDPRVLDPGFGQEIRVQIVRRVEHREVVRGFVVDTAVVAVVGEIVGFVDLELVVALVRDAPIRRENTPTGGTRYRQRGRPLACTPVVDGLHEGFVCDHEGAPGGAERSGFGAKTKASRTGGPLSPRRARPGRNYARRSSRMPLGSLGSPKS